MYLSILKENEKKLFLDLAYALSSADGNIANEEKSMIKHYCEEMGIEKYIPSTSEKKEMFKELANITDVQSKKIFVFELIGLAMTDNCYDETEKQFIIETASKFELSNSFIKNCENIISEYLSFQTKINSLVLE